MKQIVKTLIAAACLAALAPVAVAAGETSATVPVGVTLAESCTLSAPTSVDFPITNAMATFGEIARVPIAVSVTCTENTAWQLSTDASLYVMTGQMAVQVQDTAGNNIYSQPVTGTGTGNVDVPQAVTVYGKLLKASGSDADRVLGAGGTVGTHSAAVKLMLYW